MKISEIIGKNIDDLMKKNKISNRQMAEIINVTHPTIGKYLRGGKIIDSEKLSIIASYFDKPFDYFFTDIHDEIGLLFRADKPEDELKESDISTIYTKFEQYIDIVGQSRFNFIPQKYNISITEKKLIDKDEAFLEKIAYEQRRYFNSENVIPENYFSVVEDKGINVISSAFHNGSFFGASSYSEEYGSFIFVNTHNLISEERQIFTLFHEYGHLLFNRSDYRESDYNPFYGGNGDIKEKVVNSFAGYFLLPRYLVKDYIEARNKNVDITEMKHHFKVSIQTLYIALKKYNYITKEQSNEFWKKVHQNGWKKTEPNPLEKSGFDEKNNKLISSLKQLYNEDEISANKISEVLNIDLIDTRKLLKNWSDMDEHYERLS